MKSLEIVDKRIQELEDAIKHHKERSELFEIEDDHVWLMNLRECIDECEQIKQDLEVLEIIRNKKVDVYYLHTLLKNGEVDVVLNRYNIYAREGALTMEELLKLKQWLEVNDNE